MSEEGWNHLLEETGWDITNMRDARYDLVLHLTTAAIGAEKFYTGANNAARLETAEEAAALDQRIEQAWVGHQHLRVIDNSTGFDEKVDRTVKSICDHIGAPLHTGRRRYFLVKEASAKALKEQTERENVKTVTMRLQYDYLNRDPEAPGKRTRIQRRGAAFPFTYSVLDTLQAKSQDNDEIITRKERRSLSVHEHRLLESQTDPSCQTIVKDRQVFAWKQQYWEVDTILEPASHAGMSLLTVDLIGKDQLEGKLEMPPWLDVVKEVSGDERYQTFDIAKRPVEKV